MKTENSKSKFNSINFASFFSKENLPLLSLIVLIIFSIITIIVSQLVLKTPLVACCLLIILEALLAACLDKIPLWLHGIVFIAQIVSGILADKLVLMILMAIIYILAIAFLFIWSDHEKH